MSLIKEGIIATEQIAIGKVKLMRKQEVKINTEKISDEEIKLHVDKFNKALDDYKTILSETKVDNDTQKKVIEAHLSLSLIHISEPTRPCGTSRMPSSA